MRVLTVRVNIYMVMNETLIPFVTPTRLIIEDTTSAVPSNKVINQTTECKF